MNRGACWATLHGVAKSQTQLNDSHIAKLTSVWFISQLSITSPAWLLEFLQPGWAPMGRRFTVWPHKIGDLQEATTQVRLGDP